MEKYQKIERLGEGAHGVVFKARVLSEKESKKRKKSQKTLQLESSPLQTEKDKELEKATSEKLEEIKEEEKYVAIKKIRIKNSQEGLSQDAIREIRLLQELSHPNVMKVLDIFSHSANINVVLEYMLTDLDHILRAKEILLLPGNVKAYLKMILQAVEHCHTNWVLHRDIKPGNLLVGPDGQLKLADFGLAKIYGSPDRSLSHQACTLFYRPPELLFGARRYGSGADMWSVGCVFAELMLRVPLFPGKTELDQLSKIFSCLGTPTEADWPGMKKLPHYTEFQQWPATPLEQVFPAASADALDLLKQMLRYDPLKRISATNALSHRYFTSPPAPSVLALPKFEKKGAKKQQ